MPVTPLAPDTPDITTFGGPYQNYDTVIDPTTELDTAPFNRLLTQLVATGHTAYRAWVKVVNTGGLYTIVDHDAVWGSTASVKPQVTGGGAPPAPQTPTVGRGTIIWAPTQSDLQPVPEVHTLALRTATAYASIHVATVPAVTCSAWVSAPNVVTFAIANGAFVDPDEFTILVW